MSLLFVVQVPQMIVVHKGSHRCEGITLHAESNERNTDTLQSLIVNDERLRIFTFFDGLCGINGYTFECMGLPL